MMATNGSLEPVLGPLAGISRLGAPPIPDRYEYSLPQSDTSVSDRALKEDVTEVDVVTTLRALMDVPVRAWRYTADPDVTHMGPMAQDFHRAFGLGEDDRTIFSMDVNGVAVAAVQGLYSLLEEAQRDIASLRNRVEQLEHDAQARLP